MRQIRADQHAEGYRFGRGGGGDPLWSESDQRSLAAVLALCHEDAAHLCGHVDCLKFDPGVPGAADVSAVLHPDLSGRRESLGRESLSCMRLTVER